MHIVSRTFEIKFKQNKSLKKKNIFLDFQYTYLSNPSVVYSIDLLEFIAEFLICNII